MTHVKPPLPTNPAPATERKYKRPLVTCGQCGWKMRFDVLLPHTKLRHPGEVEFFTTKIPFGRKSWLK